MHFLASIHPRALIAIVLFALAIVAAGDAPREVDKLKEIQAVIERQGMEMPAHWQSRYPDKLLQYCSSFLEDLKVGKNIEVIEPVMRTDDPNHPSLTDYRNACRDTRDPNVTYHNLSDFGTHGFRLFRIELDGNPRNGPEEVLYAEGNPRRFGNGAFYRVDLKRCTTKPFGHPCCNTTLTPQDTRAAVTNVNAIIRYRESFYLLDMEGEKMKDGKDFRYGINLRWAHGAGAHYQCRFAWPY